MRGKQRWYCPHCRRTFGQRRLPLRRARQRIWFERWIREGYSIRQLAQQSGLSPASLRRIIAYWLDRLPHPTAAWSCYHHLVIDGTYLEGNGPAIVAIADPTCNRIVTGWYGLTERSPRVTKLCAELARQGLVARSVTLDGLPTVTAMVRTVWPNAYIQRCIVHVQRQGLSWCRVHPKRIEARTLRTLFLRLSHIHSQSDRDHFVQAWTTWEEQYGRLIEPRPERGYVFADLKRARVLLLRALPHLFIYLDHPDVPSTTNWIEGYFSRLKARYRCHRGLSRQHREHYFAWYFHLCPR